MEISPELERSRSSTNDTTWMSNGCTFARQIASQVQKDTKHTGGTYVIDTALTVEILRCLQVLSQAWPSFATQVLCIFSFLGAKHASFQAFVYAGQSRPSSLYTSWNARRLPVCTVRSNYSRAQAQLEFHILSQCGVLCGRLSVGRELWEY